MELILLEFRITKLYGKRHLRTILFALNLEFFVSTERVFKIAPDVCAVADVTEALKKL